MHQNVLHLGGTAGTLLLTCYVIAGLGTTAAGFLPGNAPRLRLLCITLGLSLTGWSAKVLIAGGTMIVGPGVLLVPLTLTAIAVIGAYRAYIRRPPTRLSRPHPAAARTYTAPHSPFTMPAAPAPAHLPYAPLPTHTGLRAAHSTPATAHVAPTAIHGAADSALAATHGAPAALHGARAATDSAPAATHGAQAQHLSMATTRPRFHGHAIAPPAAFPTPPRFAPQPLHNVPSPRPALDDRITTHAPAPHLQPSQTATPSATQNLPGTQEWARAQAWTGMHDHLNTQTRPTTRDDLSAQPRTTAQDHLNSRHRTGAHDGSGVQSPARMQGSARVHDPAPLRDSSRLQDPAGRSRGFVPPQHTESTTPSPTDAPAVRMALAPVTDPSPLQPSAVRARHRAAGTSA